MTVLGSLTDVNKHEKTIIKAKKKAKDPNLIDATNKNMKPTGILQYILNSKKNYMYFDRKTHFDIQQEHLSSVTYLIS